MNPCCLCYKLKKGVQFFAIFDVIFSIVGFLLSGFTVAFFACLDHESKYSPNPEAEQLFTPIFSPNRSSGAYRYNYTFIIRLVQILFSVIMAALFITLLVAAINLHIGTKKNSWRKVQLGFRILLCAFIGMIICKSAVISTAIREWADPSTRKWIGDSTLFLFTLVKELTESGVYIVVLGYQVLAIEAYIRELKQSEYVVET